MVRLTCINVKPVTVRMYAFSPTPNLSCNRNCHQARSRTSSYTLATISMHSGQRSSPELKMSTGSASGLISASPLLGKSDSYNNTIGIIGGVSVFSTLIFLEKLVWWSSRHGKECAPFIVCSDACLSREFHCQNVVSSLYGRKDQHETTDDHVIIENLRQKREFLERSGARCIVMPCHLSHSWYKEISQGCTLPFLHLGDCVAKELISKNLKPLEAGSKIQIGLISTYAIIQAGFYQDKLKKQGFDVLLPDRATMDNIILPAIAALGRKDVQGGQNLLRVAISILLMRGANMVVIASDKLQGLLPCDDPLVKKCIDPNDALARSLHACSAVSKFRSVQQIQRLPSSDLFTASIVETERTAADMRLRSRRVSGDKRGRVIPIYTQLPLVDKENRQKRSEVRFLDRTWNKDRETARRTDVVRVPGVVQVSGYNDEEKRTFFRPEKYIKSEEDEVLHALKSRSANYDMDDEDEEWLSNYNARVGSSSVSDETFESVVDAFERAIYVSPGRYKYGNVPFGLCTELCSEEVAAEVYEYWVEKRKRRKAALVGVFEANKRKKTRSRMKM